MSGIQTVKPCSRTPLKKKAEILATKIQRKLRKSTVARSDKAGARIQKHFKIQNTSQNTKHIPESKTTHKNPKQFWILGRVLDSL